MEYTPQPKEITIGEIYYKQAKKTQNIQERAEYILKAMPYLKKESTKQPNNKGVTKALMGCYQFLLVEKSIPQNAKTIEPKIGISEILHEISQLEQKLQ
ncbi:hypothetical protein HY643_03875 [Candidatus Woesearchaeota archaeon]|nr:hypothetical protein [Candidatus Woesearchaeota archaeon]